MRVAALLAPPVVLPVVLLLASCGGSDDPLAGTEASSAATPTAGSSALATPTPSAADERLAAAGVLVAADLPDWTSSPRSFSDGDLFRERARRACMGLDPVPYLARDHGRTFSRDGVEISSNADVAPSVDLAAAELAALRGVDGPRCFREPVEKSGGDIVIEVVPAVVSGADEAVAYRVTAGTVVPGGGKDRVSGFQVVARVGPTLIWQSTYEEVSFPTYPLSRLGSLVEVCAQRVRNPEAAIVPAPSASASASASASTSPTVAPSPDPSPSPSPSASSPSPGTSPNP